MPFSQTSISDVRVDVDGSELFISWSSSTMGAFYQVYVDWRLAWSGRSRRCHVPRPTSASGQNLWVHVGTVDPLEATLDFASQLPAPAGLARRGSLSWKGGTYLDPSGLDDVRGFRVYASTSPGAPIDYSTVLETVAASPGGWITDGFGFGGFGDGGFGRAATTYTWESGLLLSGVWQFAVVPYDDAGNARSPGQVASVMITEAPRPPGIQPDGTRLSAQYSGPPTRLLTLTWLPSPSTG